MFDRSGNITVNLHFEVLNNCKYNCKDCSVNKTSFLHNHINDDSSDLIELVNDLENNKILRFEFAIGPTDIISSENGFSVLQNDTVKYIIRKYSSVAISSAMLTLDKTTELSEIINETMQDKALRLVIPISFNDIHKKKYMELLKNNVAEFKRKLKRIDLRSVYLTLNMNSKNIELINNENLAKCQSIIFDTTVAFEHVFPHCRTDLKELNNRSKFINDIKMYYKKHEQCDAKYAKRVVPFINDNLEISYMSGNLYYTPMFIERFFIFDKEFIIPKPWTFKNIIEFKQDIYYKNLDKYADHPTCGNCCFLNNCSNGDQHTIMRYINYNQCLSSSKNNVRAIPNDYYKL